MKEKEKNKAKIILTKKAKRRWKRRKTTNKKNVKR